MSIGYRLIGAVFGTALCTLSPAAYAQTAAPGDSAVFFFGGQFTSQYFEFSFNPVGVRYEPNYVVGAGYQRFFFEPLADLRLGIEAGIAARFSDTLTGEAWIGGVARYEGWVLGDAIRVSPAISVGISAITGTMAGVEREREALTGGRATVLYYLAPELNFSLPDNPNAEVFWRVHHRSGGWESLGNMRDGANANTLGFRLRF